MKKECPFCKRKFAGKAPDGESFYDKHERDCEKRTPPSAMSLPVQVQITKCQNCEGMEFRFVCHYDSWNPRSALWEYACKACGQHHTSIRSLDTIASEVPYDTKGPTERKPPKWDR